ncbi:MAG: hypothetical protein HY849_05640 [Nitrosomonadales bacterium]|nr:hypothetical protein [Nitrosomonadales bacterium]
MPHQLNQQEVAMLREEVEMLMQERASLLKVVGAAAVFVANTDGRDLPDEAAEAAELLSKLVNDLPEESLKDALDSVSAALPAGE